MREGATSKHPQVNEIVFLKTSRFAGLSKQSSKDPPVDPQTLQKHPSGSRVRQRNDPRLATTRFIPARVGPELRANRCPSFPISSGRNMVFFLFYNSESERWRGRGLHTWIVGCTARRSCRRARIATAQSRKEDGP